MLVTWKALQGFKGVSMLCTYRILFIEPPKGFKGVGVDAAVMVCSLNWWLYHYYC